MERPISSQVNPERSYLVVGKDKITCNLCCAVTESMGAGFHMEWRGDFVGENPVCVASDAPRKGEYEAFTTADEVAAVQSPQVYGKRPEPRICILFENAWKR